MTTDQRLAYLEGSLIAAHAALAALQTQFYALLAAKPWTPTFHSGPLHPFSSAPTTAAPFWPWPSTQEGG